VRYLEQLRLHGAKKENVPGVAPPKLTELGFVSFGGGRPPPVGIFEPVPLSPAQEAARRDVLARLVAHPQVRRAFVTRFDGEWLVVTLGVRGVGTCEFQISAERVQSAADWAALLVRLDQAEGQA
jgi:hypothetical protein